MRLTAACLAACLAASAVPAAAAKAPTSWDGMTQVKARYFDYAYLRPGADFRSYSKVLLEPTEVAFHKDWLHKYNDQISKGSERISAAEAQAVMDEVRARFGEVLAQAYTDAGYQVVSEPAADVLNLRTGIANLSFVAPAGLHGGRAQTYSGSAGGATVIVEVRDSLSGELLGRAVDSRIAGDTGLPIRTSMTNRADFMRLFRTWARISADGLTMLKGRSPIL